MKKIFYLLAGVCIFASCSEKKEGDTATATNTATTATADTETAAKVETECPPIAEFHGMGGLEQDA